MRVLVALAALGAFATTGASAQVVPSLSGDYQCIQNCRGPAIAHVTQNGYPGHLWAQYWNEGAVYSPDGFRIQFDNGEVWQRFVPPPPPPLVRSRG
jgi:hypothetical protein